MTGLPPARSRLFARAVLTAIAIVLLTPSVLVLTGAYLPDAPVVGRFGAFVNSGLGWVWVLVVAAAVLAALANWVARSVFGVVVLGLAVIVGTGAGIVTAQVFGFAAEHGAQVSLLRTLHGAPPTRAPGERHAFATVDGVELHAEVWHGRAPDGAPAPMPRQAVVFVHGGGFTGGGLGMRPQLVDFLADAGYTVVDVEYRLAPPPRWQDAPADVLCALAWLRSQATTLALRPGEVVLMGESAGGSLVLVAGFAAEAGLGRRLTPSSSCGGSPVLPAAVVAISPAADLEGIWDDGTILLDGRPFPEAYVGGPPADFPERYEAASPSWLAGPHSPPTLIVAGAIDHLVRPARMITLAERLTAAGVDTRLVVVPYADHGFDGQPNGVGMQVLEALLPAFLADHLDE